MQPNEIELVCQELVELVSDYLNQTLPPRERTRFEAHLQTCPPCTSYLAQMTTTLEVAGEVGGARATSDTKEELVTLFRRWHATEK